MIGFNQENKMDINKFAFSKEFQELSHSDMTLVINMKIKFETGKSIATTTKLHIDNVTCFKEFHENINLIY
jgi:predicted MPP superfamily phosphohydrolase